MANLGRSLDPKKVEPAGRFEPLAAGDYPVAITHSEVVRNKQSDGTHLAVTMRVLQGPSRGRLLWLNITTAHPNPDAVTVGDQQLSAICHAVGHMTKLKDTAALHGQPFTVRVAIDPETGRNKVTRVLFEGKLADLKMPARPAASEEPAAG